MAKIDPMVLQGHYYNVFASESGKIVLGDIKLLLTGAKIEEYEGVSPLLPANELAVKTALRNAWDMIDGMTEELSKESPTVWWMVKETYKIMKHNRKRRK